MLHWNGKKWATASVPNPGGTGFTDDNEILALSCTSASNCWAAGTFGQISFTSGRVKALDELLRWNGKKWQKAGTPNPGGSTNELLGVKCTSASKCFAVGGAFTAGVANIDELLQWNGKKWAVR